MASPLLTTPQEMTPAESEQGQVFQFGNLENDENHNNNNNDNIDTINNNNNNTMLKPNTFGQPAQEEQMKNGEGPAPTKQQVQGRPLSLDQFSG